MSGVAKGPAAALAHLLAGNDLTGMLWNDDGDRVAVTFFLKKEHGCLYRRLPHDPKLVVELDDDKLTLTEFLDSFENWEAPNG